MASELDPLFRSMAAAVIDAAPADWRSAVLICEVSSSSAGSRVVYERPDGLDGGFSAPIDAKALAEAVHDAGVELSVRPSGEYEAVITPQDEHRPDSETYVLDPSHRPPQPGERQQGPRDTSPAGDPAEAARLMNELLWLKRELVGDIDPPRPPASAELIAGLERRAGSTAPADLRALYEVTDGDPLAIYGHEWLPLAELARLAPSARERCWNGWAQGWDEVVLDADPPGRVRRVTGHPRWIPFAHDGGGNYLAVDMAPAEGGRPGQVIMMGRDFGDGPGRLADSVTGLLRMELDTIRRGDYDAEEDGYIELFGPEWDQTPARNARERRIDARRATLNSLGPEVQRLIVGHGSVLDLSPLHNAPMLHDLQLTCHDPGLGPLLDLPLDNLVLNVDTVDLAPLAGHPTLRTLTLATRQPVDITPLGTLPLLDGLHLADAAITDMAKLPDTLKFLKMRAGQWRELRERTARLPELAAAGLAGDVRHDDYLRWASAFPGFRPPEETRLSGRLSP